MTRSTLMLILTACVFLTAVVAVAQDDTAPADTPPTPMVLDNEGDGGGDAAAPADGETGEVGEKKEAVEGGDDSNPGMDWKFPAIIIGALVLMWVFASRSKRKQETKRREMLASLNKGDKVVSIGGICGTIVETREDEVVVKVDDTGNVRMRFARWAIRGTGDVAKAEDPNTQQQDDKK